MAWLAVDKDGEERIFEDIPHREDGYFWNTDSVCSIISLPHGSIKKLIGGELTWEDESVMLED